MIVKDLTKRKDEVIAILYSVFHVYYPNESYSWFEEQVKGINYQISLGFELNNKLIGIYLLNEENYENKTGIGLHGEALAVLPEYRGNKIYEQFLNYIKKEYESDYIWGKADKKLNNINFWLKYRNLEKEDSIHYYTIQYLK